MFYTEIEHAQVCRDYAVRPAARKVFNVQSPVVHNLWAPLGEQDAELVNEHVTSSLVAFKKTFSVTAINQSLCTALQALLGSGNTTSQFICDYNNELIMNYNNESII